ncbi:hypothetical protein NL477_26445, partial [Klebsiella pneumoniae]|nr:hypothetical protein [Klebsiella pneumoniae]
GESGRFDGGRVRVFVLAAGSAGSAESAGWGGSAGSAGSAGDAAHAARPSLERVARRARQALGGRSVLALTRRDHAALVVPASFGRFADPERIAAT